MCNLSSKISETYRAVSDQSDNVNRLILGSSYISEDTIKRGLVVALESNYSPPRLWRILVVTITDLKGEL